MHPATRLCLPLLGLLLGGCDSTTPAGATPRWYDAERAQRGAVVYRAHCARCHGDRAQGTADWRRTGPDGHYPPPPLDGSAHTWHHPLALLLRVIRDGSPGGLGNMPAWKETLSDEQILSIIAWLQSRWPEQTYDTWTRIEAKSRQGGAGG